MNDSSAKIYADNPTMRVVKSPSAGENHAHEAKTIDLNAGSNTNGETNQHEESSFKVTSSETVGRASTKSLGQKIGRGIRSAGFGVVGALVENAPGWAKAGLTGVALIKVAHDILSPDQKYGGFVNKLKHIGSNYAQGSLSTSLMEGKTMKFDVTNLALGFLALKDSPQMAQAVEQMGGMGGAGSMFGGVGGPSK